MSQSSSEKLRDETSSLELDEDSGHDSVDDISSPADERERIASLETAVAWIRQEVVSDCLCSEGDGVDEAWRVIWEVLMGENWNFMGRCQLMHL